jgi:AbrB family looped-hinge helix DNA binding protein
MYKQDKMYGTTSMGARGQVVIPAEARKDLKLKPGDKLVVMGKFGKALGLVKVEAMQEIVSMIMEHIGNKQVKGDFKKHLEKLTKEFIK